VEPLGHFDFRYVDENPTAQFSSTRVWTYEQLVSIRARAKYELNELTESLTIDDIDDDKRAGLESTRAGLISVIKVLDVMIESMEKMLSKLYENMKKHQMNDLIANLDKLNISKEDIELAYGYMLLNTKRTGITGVESAPKPEEIEHAEELTPKGVDWIFSALYEAVTGKEKSTYQSYIFTENGKVKVKATMREEGMLEILDQKCVILDGSADVETYKTYLPSLKVTKIDVEITLPHKIVYMENFSGSMKSQSRESSFERLVNSLKLQIKPENGGKNIGLVAAKALADRGRDAGWEEKGDLIEHYGAGATGSNRLENLDTLITTQYTPNLNALYVEYQGITGERFELEFEEVYLFEHHFCKMVLRRVPKHLGFRNFIARKIKGYNQQAVGRARMTQREKINPETGEKGNIATIYYAGDPLYWPDELPEFTHTIKVKNVKKHKQQKKTTGMLNNMQKTAEEIKKMIKQMKSKVNVKEYLKYFGKWNMAQKLAEKLDVSAKTIMRYFSDLTFWRIFEQAKVGQVDEQDVVKYLVAILARRMRLSGEIADEKVLLSKL
jgi:hypothetical protein